MQNLSVSQLKAARALLSWSQEKLADVSGLSIATIKRLEAESGWLGGRISTLKEIRSAFEANGIEFVNQSGRSIGVIFYERRKK